MTDEQFITNSRLLGIFVLKACEAKQMTRDEAASTAACALMEALGQLLGPVRAVNRLRDLADLAERQYLDACN